MQIELSAAELASLTNAVLDFYIKGDPIKQSIQDKPTLKAFRGSEKEFPGGRQLIRGNVKGDFTTTFMGYSYDDTVTYTNPADIKQFSWEWFELHGGLGLTHTELKQAGISVVDTLTGENTRQLSDTDHMVISNLLDDKLDSMNEGLERSFNNILWGDGTASPKIFPGITAVIRQTPTSGFIGGIDSAANTWWRNRSLCGANKITVSPTNSTLILTLQNEMRQLRRYGGRPSMLPAGNNFIKALEAEIHAKGTFTQYGWAKDIEVGIGDVTIRGLGKVEYDPTMDDLGYTNFMLAMDKRHIKLMPMKGENMKKHAPARPENKYVLYRAITWTGSFMANKLNAHGIYEINPTY